MMRPALQLCNFSNNQGYLCYGTFYLSKLSLDSHDIYHYDIYIYVYINKKKHAIKI